ncbi:deoxyribonuclease IV [Ureaplasma urealyticum]|uniref:deoxyribonuclease IV n=1 Tax=Ureaplasma urealyticum TaxID=2130 RepID=UPI000302AE2C|nr:deoxyribonuclease IV [Ureaplasma urealyticum]
MDKYNLIIGSHVSLKANDFFYGSVKEALSYGANTLMVYTGAPQNTRRQPIELFKINEAHNLLKEHNIDLNNLIVHAPYIINPCSSKKYVRELAKEFLIQEIERTQSMGITKIVLHPGSCLDQDEDIALKQVYTMLNEIFATINTNVVVCLETMSGKGSEIGINLKQLKTIIDNVDSKKNIGVCLDTCHMSDSSIALDHDSFNQYLKEFDAQIGIDYIKVLHINDSKNPRGANKDRHENLGYGTIGFDNLINIIYHPLLNNIPKILETPWFDFHDQSISLYEYEIKMIRDRKWFDIKYKLLVGNK